MNFVLTDCNAAKLRYNCHGRHCLSIVFDSTPLRKGRRNMKKTWVIGIVMLLAAGLGGILYAAAQGPLDRLESDIRSSNGPPVLRSPHPSGSILARLPTTTAGRGVKVLSVRPGGPADRAGLQPQDLIVRAAGRKIRLLSELSAILNGLNPSDHLSLEVMRGNRPLRIEVVLGTAPATLPPAAPPPLGPGRQAA